jgi:hypothetical protein
MHDISWVYDSCAVAVNLFLQLQETSKDLWPCYSVGTERASPSPTDHLLAPIETWNSISSCPTCNQMLWYDEAWKQSVSLLWRSPYKWGYHRLLLTEETWKQNISLFTKLFSKCMIQHIFATVRWSSVSEPFVSVSFLVWTIHNTRKMNAGF